MVGEIYIGKKKYDLRSLCGLSREEVEQTKDKNIINIFNAMNTNGDGVLDTNEVSIFSSALKNSDADSDGNITNKELKMFVKENDFNSDFGIKPSGIISFLEKIPKMMKKNEIAFSQYSVEQLSVDEAKEESINMLADEVQRGFEIMEGQDDGAISRGYNGLKEYFGSAMSQSSLMKNLYIKNETTNILSKAQGGTLTKGEYFKQIRENFFETFPGVENYDDGKKVELAQYITGLQPQQIERLQDKILSLPSPDDPEYGEKLSRFIDDFQGEAVTKSTVIISTGDSVTTMSTKFLPKQPYYIENEDELMSFEDTFSRRQGVEYDRAKIENYIEAETNFALTSIVSQGKNTKNSSAALESAYRKAFGGKNLELLANAYVQDQEKAVKNVRRGIEYAGTGAMIVGAFCCPALALGAGVASSLGGVGTEMLNEATRNNVSPERIEELKNELAQNGTLMVVGMGAGMTGCVAKGIAEAMKCPKLVQMATEIGVDATLSLVGDLAVTGQIDLKGEGFSQAISILTGLKGAKIGIEKASAQLDIMGIAYQPQRSSLFGRLFGYQDIEPNNPLNRYKIDASRTQSHSDFYTAHPELFGQNKLMAGTCWAGHQSSDSMHGAWKMHIYSINEADWQKISKAIIPYLNDNDIDWKTFHKHFSANELDGDQKGKAFTIYPGNKQDFEKIARDLDYIIRNNRLDESNSNIIGDRQLGSTGRLFYRYEFTSGRYKNDILDLSENSRDRVKYNAIYQSNRGNGGWLANDMSITDDPWYNFDPSKPDSNQNINQKQLANNDIFAGRQIRRITQAGRLQQNEIYNLGRINYLRLNNTRINLNHPYIQNLLANMSEGSYIKVGRGADCEVKINDPSGTVSRAHLIIYKRNGELYIQDISTNGTFVD